MMRFVVVGAGWSGLAAATFLQENGHDVTVFEAASHVGGRIATSAAHGGLVEHGPHGVFDRGAPAKLAELAGVELVAAPQRAPRFVVQGGVLVPVLLCPPGILATPLLHGSAKLRLLAEPLVPRARQDESIADLTRRRLGPDVLPLLDAMVGGIHAGDPTRLSARHAFPRIWAMDQGKGVLRTIAAARNPPARLVAPRQGMQGWMQALAERLDVRLDEPAKAIFTDAGVLVETTRAKIPADAVIVALDPLATAGLLGIQVPPPPVAPVTIVTFTVEADKAPHEGYGYLAPEGEHRFLLGALYESVLFPGRAPAGQALVRCFVGGRRHPKRAHLSDDELIATAWQELKDLDLVGGQPMDASVIRTAGIPQLELGHERWLSALPSNGLVHTIGIGHRGVGLEALAEEAYHLARKLSPAPQSPANLPHPAAG